jgi:DNA-binding NarL/FixJ family response regulator
MPIPVVSRILIADDHAIVRSGLKKVLDAKPDLEVVAEAEDGAEAVEKSLKEDVDLAILDVSMPRMTGIQAAAELHKRRAELKTLMLSMHDTEQFLFEALKAGASGYVLKSGADTDIVDACRAAMRGDSYLYPSAVTTLVRDYVETRRPRRRAVRRADAPRARGVEADHRGLHLEGNCRGIVHQHQDRRPPPPEHPRQAGHARPRRADALPRSGAA